MGTSSECLVQAWAVPTAKLEEGFRQRTRRASGTPSKVNEDSAMIMEVQPQTPIVNS